ncbi:MAG TPA: Ldh family oxidoreductase, partial [Clostridiales bacterium]|nr:Ldh family oxidoreductase [Clostridiales bacterium]
GAYGKDLNGKDKDGNICPYHLGHFFIAIDTGHFLGEEEARKKAGEIIRSVRNSKKAPGEERIYTAGEKEWDVWQYRKDKGVPITEPVQKELIEVRDHLGLTQYKFPWEE